jgi:hypothetical protein
MDLDLSSWARRRRETGPRPFESCSSLPPGSSRKAPISPLRASGTLSADGSSNDPGRPESPRWSQHDPLGLEPLVAELGTLRVSPLHDFMRFRGSTHQLMGWRPSPEPSKRHRPLTNSAPASVSSSSFKASGRERLGSIRRGICRVLIGHEIRLQCKEALRLTPVPSYGYQPPSREDVRL